MVILQTNSLRQCQRAVGTFIANRRTLQRFTSVCSNLQQQTSQQKQRQLWGYVAIAFNKVDNDRLSKVGPDRLCAEWVLKNGGAVGFTGMQNKLLKDYNSLPSENVKFNVQIVDASDSSIMKMGLEHFRDCRHIDTVILHNCKHLEDGGLEGLEHLKNTLKRLQVSGCYNLRDSCFDVIMKLTALEQLRLFDLIYVKDIQGIAAKVLKALPNCKVEVKPAN